MFRVFNETKNTYNDGNDYIVGEQSRTLFLASFDGGWLDSVESGDKLIIEQDIGITDYKGYPIYEGDIVQYLDKTTKFRPYKENSKFMIGYVLKSDDGVTGQMKSGIYQVVGNIHNVEK